MGKLTPAFRLYKIPLFFLLVGLTVLVLLPLQDAIDTYMEEFKRQTIEALEERIGREIVYEKISPSILLSLNIYNIRIAPFDSEKEENLSIDRIEIFYSLMDLLKGKTIDAVSEIAVKNTTIRIDKERDPELLRLIEDVLSPDTDTPTEIPFNDIVLSGENISIFYSDGESRYELRRLFFNLRNSGDPQMPFALSTRGELSVELESSIGTETTNITEASTHFSFEGLLNDTLDSFSSRVSLENFSNNLFSFQNLTLEINQDQEKTSIRKIEDSSPWDVELIYRPENEEISLDFAAKEFAFTDNIEASEDFEPLSIWLDTRISGNAQVTYSIIEEKLSYKTDLTAEVDNSVVPEAFTAEILAEGTEERVLFDRLRISSKSGDLEYTGSLDTGTLLPEGSLQVRRLSLGGHSFRTSLNLSSKRDRIEIDAPYLMIDSVLRLDDISLSGVLDGSLINYEAEFSIYRQDGSREIENRTETEGTVSFGDSPSFEGSISMKSAPLLPLVETFRPDLPLEEVPFQELTVSTDAFLSTNFSSFFFSMQTLELEDRDGDFTLTTRVQGNNNLFQLNDIFVSYKDYELDGSTFIDFSSPDSMKFDSSFQMNSETYTLSGTYYKNSTLILRGNHDITGTVFFQKGNIAFSASAENIPIPIDETPMEISLSGRGRISQNNGWYGHLSFLSIDSPPGLPQESSLSFSAKANSERIKVSNIHYSDNVSELTGEAWFSPQSTDPLQGNGWLTLASGGDDEEIEENGEESSEESYRTVFSLLDNTLEATMSINSAPLDRWKMLPVRGDMDGVFRAHGPVDDPVIDFSSQIKKGEFRNSPFEIDAEGSIESTHISLSRLRGSYNAYDIREVEGDYDLLQGSLRLEGDYQSTIGKQATSAHFSIEGEAEPIDSIQSITKIPEEDFLASVSVSDILILGEERNPWDISIEKKGELVSFNGGPEDAVSGTFRENGEYTLEMGRPLPVRFLSEGQISEGDIDSRVNDLFVDMEAFEELGFTRVLFSSGSITGDFSIKGPLSDPEFDGTLSGNSVSGTIDEVAEPIDPFSTGIQFDGKECIIEPVNITAGEGEAVLEGGFTFDRWTPDNIRINASTVGSRGIPVSLRLRESGLSIDGYGQGDFSLTVERTLSRIEGDIRVSDCIITLQEREEAAEDEIPPPLIVDMEIETGPRVEFIWPRRRLPILSAYTDTGQEVSIYYSSVEERLRFTGEVNIKGGEVFYFQRSFYLREGSITFNETENSFNPLLNAQAEIREIDTSGNPVTISLIVDNEPLKSFTPRFEATPHLSMQEIAQIFGTSIYGSPEEQELSLNSALMLTGDLFARFGLVRTFENQVKEVFNLDLFSLRTQLVQNVIFDRLGGQNTSLREEETLQQADPLDRYLDNTTLFLGKYLGNDLFMEALLQINQQPNYIGDLQDQDLNFSLELGLEWKTPLFLLNLSVNPDFYEPEKSLSNTSFGLSWDYSY
ncbi:MAG: translocation/assembly module TamB domain-containing protein [Spirochaetia bacterium]